MTYETPNFTQVVRYSVEEAIIYTQKQETLLQDPSPLSDAIKAEAILLEAEKAEQAQAPGADALLNHAREAKRIIRNSRTYADMRRGLQDLITPILASGSAAAS